MPGRECYHCKQWVEEGQAHDCWTTTEAALTKDLSVDLREAWERIRETAVEFGEQRIYASHNSIMFSRTSCYCFVRPKRSFLEVCIFLPRAVVAPQVKKSGPASKTKFANLLHIRHRDEVEPPITDWLEEAYAFNTAPKPPVIAAPKTAVAAKRSAAKKAKKAAKKPSPPRTTRTAKEKTVARKTTAKKAAKKR